jgi:hypothetical protein
MKITLGYSMGYAGTDTEWEDELPEDIDPNNKQAVEAYLEELQQALWQEACEHISVWAEIAQ